MQRVHFFQRAFNTVAFDLVDARGRTFPLLMQLRPQLPTDNGEGYFASGALVSRDSAHTELATIRYPEHWAATLQLKMTEESARFFATYAPHGDVKYTDLQFSQLSPVHDGESDLKGEWVSLWATVNQPGFTYDYVLSLDWEELDMMTETRASTLERGRVVLEELRTLCGAAGKLCFLQPEEYSMFSAYHPPAVVRSFTVAALSPVLLSVPSDVLGLIADYTWLELPYLPMSLPDKVLEWSTRAFRRTVEDEDDWNA